MAQQGFKDPVDNPYELGKLVQFDQREFVHMDFDTSTFKDFGLVYVPNACESKNCYVHAILHGCNQSLDDITKNYGYNEFAAANDIILLYPDSTCWGFNKTLDDPQWLTMNGVMPSAIMGMLNRTTM